MESPEEGGSVVGGALGVNAVVVAGLGDFKVYTKCSPPAPAHSPKLLVSQCVLSPRTQPSASLYMS